MKKRIKQIVIFCILGLLGLPGGPPEAQESWQSWLFGEATAQGQATAPETPSNITPSHVFQATEDLIAEIEILRSEMGISDYPQEVELQEDRTPVHVYAKTLEVMRKIARVRSKFGLPPLQVGQIPVKVIEPRDVFDNVQLMLDALRRVKTQFVIENEIQPAPLVGAKRPSDVYQNLGDASFLLDGLVGRPLTPNDVHNNMLRIQDEMELVAARLQATLELDLPPVEGRRRPRDVAQQVLRAGYKIVNLQTRLGMDASSVPTLTLVRVTPSEVYEITNILLAEMARIKAHLDINLPHEERPNSRNKTPTDVFAESLRMIRNLDILAVAAAQTEVENGRVARTPD